MEMENYFNEDLYNKICNYELSNEYENLVPQIEQELNRLFSDYDKFKDIKHFQHFLDIDQFLILHGYKVWIFREFEIEGLNDSSNNEIEFVFKVSTTLR